MLGTICAFRTTVAAVTGEPARAMALGHEAFRLLPSEEFYVAHNKNRAGEIHGLGIELRAAPGYYGARRIAALDLGWQATLFSHIRHSAETKETFQGRYPSGVRETGPVDGWYGSTAHRFRIGLVGASKQSDSMALQVALGSLFAVQKQGVFFGFDFAQLPVYLETSLRFDR